MDFEIRDAVGVRTYIIRENITSSLMHDLEFDLMAYYSNEVGDVVVDIRNVTCLDSLSLAVFLKIKNMLADKERKFKLVNPSDPVRRVIEVASLESFLLENGE